MNNVDIEGGKAKFGATDLSVLCVCVSLEVDTNKALKHTLKTDHSCPECTSFNTSCKIE